MPASAPDSPSPAWPACSEQFSWKFREGCLDEDGFASRVDYNEVRGG